MIRRAAEIRLIAERGPTKPCGTIGALFPSLTVRQLITFYLICRAALNFIFRIFNRCIYFCLTILPKSVTYVPENGQSKIGFSNCVDRDRLPVFLAAVKANLSEDASQVLAEAGFRPEAVFERL